MSVLTDLIVAQLLPHGTSVKEFQEGLQEFLTRLAETMQAVDRLEKKLDALLASQSESEVVKWQ